MDREPVDSEAIKSVGYDQDENILEIAFMDDGVYRYFDVPVDVYNEFMAAESPGQFFQRRIKAHYDHEQADEHGG